MKNKVIVMISVALMLMILVTANISTVKAAVPDSTYVEEDIGEPMNADISFQYDSASLQMLLNVYEPLVYWDFNSINKFVGMIADSWLGQSVNVTDPITGVNYLYQYTFHIRSGVHFHSSGAVVVPGEGDEVTPADVEYSFERNMVVDSSTGGESLIWDPLLHVGSADLEDPLWGRKIDFAVQSDAAARTVTFYLLSPYEPFLQIMSQAYGGIYSEKWSVDPTLHPNNWPGTWPDWTKPNSATNNYTAWQAYHDPTTSPIEEVDCSSSTTHPHLDYILGTGPYMFDYWNKGAGGHYKLVRNPNYWSDRGGSWGVHAHEDSYVLYNVAEWETRRDDFKAGTCDVCNVPVTYKDQVENYTGIRCLKGFGQLYCLGEFFNGGISSASTYSGTMPPNGTFASTGFPQDGFTDITLRKAFRALFPFTDFLADAYLNEAVQPASWLVNGLAYYDPSIQKPVYDRNLAIKLLKEAWGGSEASPGPVWKNGFTMNLVYNEGNEMRRIAAEMLSAEFDSINAEFGTHFNTVVVSVPWGGYSILWRSRVLPMYCVAWGADFADPANFVDPFMNGLTGAFARFQGFLNATIQQWIRNGIDSTIPSERQMWYSQLSQAYVDNCYSIALAQPTYRRWERDWVQGWFFHIVLLDEDYVYNNWEANEAGIKHDIALSATVPPGPKVINLGDVPELIDVGFTNHYKDGSTKTGVYEDWVAPGNANGISYWKFVDLNAVWNEIRFIGFPYGAVIAYLPQRVDANPSNNAAVSVTTLIGDINGDGKVNILDVSKAALAFGSYPGHIRWDPTADIDGNKKITIVDIAKMALQFGKDITSPHA
jgi:peptide/nickel transport system substrate-binding protein